MPVSKLVRNLCVLVPVGTLFVYGGIQLAAHPLNLANPKIIVGKQSDGTYFVPTGQTLAPVGKNLPFDGRPVDLAMRPDGKVLAVMLGSEIKFLDTATGEFKPNDLRGGHSFGGIVWTKDGRTLYATTNTGVSMIRFDDADKPETLKPIEIDLNSRIKPNRSAKASKPCGLALSPDEKTLYAPLFNNGTLAAIDLSSYKPDSGDAKFVEVPVGSSPERVVVSAGGDKIYVANRGGKAPEDGDTVDKSDPVVVDPDTYKASTGTLSVVSTAKIATDPEHAATKSINVGLQPTNLAMSPNGSLLYAANANADTISVIRTSDDIVVETIPTSPAPGRLAESSPNGLAVAPDGRTLYVSLGGDNAIEVLPLSTAAGGAGDKTHIAGLIPTAWFPIGVALSKDATSLYVINSKGIGSAGPIVKKSRASSGAMTPEEGPGGTVIGGDFVGHSVYAVMGSVGIIQVPDANTLHQYTNAVAKNNDFSQMDRAIKQPRDPFWSRFKHVILVIKENRTYDQILGDIPLGDGHIGGDPKLVMFGEKVTPNQHAIAREFGLFDNLYCSGAISADGHHWLNEAFADDYAERGMNNYPRSYPCCGTDPLVFAGNPFLWEAALKAGRTFYNYGEFGPLPSMQRHSDNDFSARFEVTADRNRDVAHCERVLSDIQKPEKGLAQLTTIWFGNNHTSGTTPGAFTPEACVADNDLAVGMLVEAVSHNKKYWEDEPTAIFIIEDDAQGGLDHVEGHRTTGFVISPFNKRKQIVSTNMNQLSMIRTIELMLDLKPLNQFDAAANSMRSLFQEKADFKPFDLVKNKIALNLKNPPRQRVSGNARHWADVSVTLDFSEPDRADPEKLTEILWHHTHGDAAYPPVDAAR